MRKIYTRTGFYLTSILTMPTFAYKAINYFTHLKSPAKLLGGIEIMNPYQNDDTKTLVQNFFQKYYNDNSNRVFILGINPGRFGGGLTGISFTDPVALKKHCGIDNQLGNREELSSKFIYKVISQFGGVNNFFSNYFLSALYPLALIKDGKNYNYYDSKKIFSTLKPYLKDTLVSQIKFGAVRKAVICLGKKNAVYLKILNDELKLFENIETLDHPRFIMQYKRKDLNRYINQYLNVLQKYSN